MVISVLYEGKGSSEKLRLEETRGLTAGKCGGMIVASQLATRVAKI